MSFLFPSFTRKKAASPDSGSDADDQPPAVNPDAEEDQKPPAVNPDAGSEEDKKPPAVNEAESFDEDEATDTFDPIPRPSARASPAFRPMDVADMENMGNHVLREMVGLLSQQLDHIDTMVNNSEARQMASLNQRTGQVITAVVDTEGKVLNQVKDSEGNLIRHVEEVGVQLANLVGTLGTQMTDRNETSEGRMVDRHLQVCSALGSMLEVKGNSKCISAVCLFFVALHPPVDRSPLAHFLLAAPPVAVAATNTTNTPPTPPPARRGGAAALVPPTPSTFMGQDYENLDMARLIQNYLSEHLHNRPNAFVDVKKMMKDLGFGIDGKLLQRCLLCAPLCMPAAA